MIRSEELLEIAAFKGLSPKLAELDYVQDVALANLYREFGNKLVFKGGTCLYKVFQLNRFSEDLDFTIVKGFKPRDFFQRIPYFFKLLDMKAIVKVEEFESTINIYVAINGPLYDGTKESQATLAINISQRERVLLPAQRFSYKPAYRDLRPFDLFAMDEGEILAEKVRAIYARKKARDVFDTLYLLKTKNVSLDPALANKKLSKDGMKFDKATFLRKVGEKKDNWQLDLAGLVSGELPLFEEAVKQISEAL